MSIPHSYLAQLEHAYRVLALPHSASPLAIRREYRRLAKRWHPDRFADHSPEQVYATERMREVNYAYQSIKHAPLRYRPPTHAPRSQRNTDYTPPPTWPAPDTLEYLVRFIAGVFFGTLVGFGAILGGLTVGIAATIPLVMGAAAVWFGDRFWYFVLKWWWLWQP